MSRPKVARRIRRLGVCHYCGNRNAEEMTVDHLVPLSRGGTWSAANLACCCFKCNVSKGSMTEPEYREHIRVHGFPWLARDVPPDQRPAALEEWQRRVEAFVRYRHPASKAWSTRAERIAWLVRLLTYLEDRFASTEQSA